MTGNKLQSLDRDIFVNAVHFFSVALDIKDSDMGLTVKTVDNIGRGDTAGVCRVDVSYEGEFSNVRIEIKEGITIFGMVEALAHEMVHAEQFIKKKISFKNEKKYLFGLFPYNDRRRIWKGTFDITDIDYYSNPAEVEAFLKQRALTLEFMKSIESKIMPNNVFDHMMKDRDDVDDYSSSIDLNFSTATDNIYLHDTNKKELDVQD